MPDSPLQQLSRSLDALGQLVQGIRDEQWDDPTPCTQWSVRDLVSHLVAGNRLFTAVLLDGVPPDVPGDGQVTRDELRTAHRESAEALLAAFASPGVMDRVVTVPFGTVPGRAALHLRLVEALVHGWDLAHATGQSPRFDDELAEQELEFTRERLADVPPERSPFGPPQAVSDDRPALDRLAACLGRDVERPAGRPGHEG